MIDTWLACRARRIWALAACLAAVVSVSASCDKTTSSPTAPSAPAPVTFAISGTVRDAATSHGIVGARLEVVEGVNQGTSASTDGDGHYRLTDLSSGSLTLRATADGFDPVTQPIALSADQVVDFALGSAPPPATPPERRTVAGAVFDAADESPIAGARVAVVEGPDRGVVIESGAGGEFSVELQTGSATIEASADGYRAFERTIEVGATDVRLEMPLEREAAPEPDGPKLAGITVDGVTNNAVDGALIALDNGETAQSAADGSFNLPVSALGTVEKVTVTSSQTVDRVTYVTTAAEPATLALMPRSLGADAFDQMFRGNGGELHRWTAAPTLIIERRVLQFTDIDDDTFVATDVVMTEDEVSGLVDDLEWAFPQLVGKAFGAFADVRVETSPEGEAVNVTRPGAMVVARYEGLGTSTSYWGYTKWAWDGRGAMQAASVMLDREFDASADPNRRSLRAHELGHALGYTHVDARTSVMNSAGRTLPTSFDRHATTVAFQRPPLNRSPDVDPEPIEVRRAPVGVLIWSGAP